MNTNLVLRRVASVVLACLVLFPCDARAQPAPWAERIPVDLVNASADVLTAHQVRLEFDTATLIASGRLRADGGDLRFGVDIAGTVPVPYWVEGGIDTATTAVWIAAPEIPANASVVVWLYIGNPAAASESQVHAVFQPSAAMLDDSSTRQVSGGGVSGSANSQRGFRFVPNEDVLMVAMGKNEPSGSPRYLTLFDFDTQQILEQMQVEGPATGYTYEMLPQPRWLRQGKQYVMQMYQSPTDGYFFGAAPSMHPKLTYLDMRYCNACSQTSFPTNSLGGMHYGYPDFLLRTRKPASPQPTGTVGTVSSRTVLGADANPAPFGGDVLLTATVASAFSPVGTVSFSDGGAPVCVDVVVSGGQAQCLVADPALGLHAFAADYSGFAEIQPSGATLDVDVVATVPDAPTAVLATPGNGTISLVFQAPAFDGGDAIVGYVAACTDGTDMFTATGFSPLLVGGLVNGTAYQCSVYASNGVGDGAASAPVSTTPATVPDAPTGLAAASGDGQATLTFAPPAFDGGASILFYTGYCVMAPLPPVIVSGPGSPLVIGGLNNATDYSCYVNATNSAGPGPVSEPVQVTPLGVPTAPTQVGAVSGDTQATVTFSPPAFDGGSPVLDYTAICDDGNQSGSASATASPILVPDLSNGAIYGCAVYARNAIGDGPLSGAVSVVPAGVPDAPTGLRAVPGDGSVALSFVAPFDGGSPILVYAASCTDGVVALDGSGAASPVAVQGLSNFVTYSCTVVARNALGDSVPSAAVSVTPPMHLLLLDGFEGVLAP